MDRRTKVYTLRERRGTLTEGCDNRSADRFLDLAMMRTIIVEQDAVLCTRPTRIPTAGLAWHCLGMRAARRDAPTRSRSALDAARRWAPPTVESRIR